MGPLGRLRFVLGYARSKVGVLWEVRSPRRAFAVFEWRYSLTNLWNGVTGGHLPAVLYNGPPHVSTTLGDFAVRPGTQDAAIVSPGFERADWDRLRHLMTREVARGRSVWFVDVGANVGTFTVRVARLFPGVRVWAVEPGPGNQAQLARNLALNGLGAPQVTVLPVAASDADGDAVLSEDALQPGNSTLREGVPGHPVTVETRRLGALLPRPPPGTTVFIKMDIEGHEARALAGLAGLYPSGARVWLMIEDIYNTDQIERRLVADGYRPRRRLTPYNAWWERPL